MNGYKLHKYFWAWIDHHKFLLSGVIFQVIEQRIVDRQNQKSETKADSQNGKYKIYNLS